MRIWGVLFDDSDGNFGESKLRTLFNRVVRFMKDSKRSWRE